ncbi:hypothetical protein V6N13_138529 [Hibiscus sabdariffa]
MEERAVASLKISHLPAAFSSELDANLDAVNKLCNHLRRGQNAIIFDDHERISNVISSILAFSSEISSPFLIICSSASQYSWDEEFLHLAPSVDVVVYSGSKEIRNSIRNLEFYDEGSCIMFQVLITSPEVISEDLNVLDCIGWEAIIVDECQCPRIGSCFEQVKMITASVRLLIISRQLKDNVAEYLNLLSLLDSQGESNGSELMNSSDNINTLKERLAKYVAYECKLESSRFLEYWVPALLSNLQLEKYCFTLVSNPLSLCSPSKTDPVGGLRTILVTSRKCCDHPYDVDQSLQMFLTKGLQEVEFLEVGIKASGKLQLLDAMLWEIKKRELKVVILFQFLHVCLAIGAAFPLQEAEVTDQYIGGSGRDLMGDILDEFLRQRFGIDCYEHVDNGVIPSKKQSALSRFNNERERFIFLLETRACLPSIKLSSVGTVIIFGSDWSPVNDLRALQRITFDSQFEQIKVFRLYSSFTVEEKLLMLSKQDKTVDSNIANISSSASHMLLKWGASYLFSQLENFHGITKLDASTLSQQSHLKDVIQEFLTLLHQTGKDNTSKLTLILQAKQNQGTYRTEMPLFGELKIQVMNEDPPHTFWTKLLEGKCPRWKYSTSTSTSLRNQKRVQYFDELQKRPEAESAEVAKKRKKFISDGSDHPSPKAVPQEGKLATGDREGSPRTSAYDFTTFSRSIASGSDKIHASSTSLHQANNISKIPALKIVEWERRKQCDSQKDLHVLLRPQIAKLCEVLHLTEDVKAMVERFLEYFMNNHLVHREPATILQAFQISLCWIAAAMLKQKLDHKESLALAKQHLGFTCRKEEADYIYSMLRCLKRMFLYRTGCLKVQTSPKASGLSSKAIERDYSNATPYQQNIKAEIEVLSDFREGSDIRTILESGVAPEIQLAQRDLLKSIKEIQKKRDKLLKKQMEKHKQEMEQFNQKYEEEKAQLENKKRTEAAVIRLHSNVSRRTEKLNNLGTEYARKFDELEQKMDTHLKNLEASHVAARSNILESRTRWVESVKSWARVELLRSSLCEVNLSEARSSGIFQSPPGSEVRPSKIVCFVDDGAMTYSDPINRARPFKDNSERASVECNLTANSGAIEEQAISKDYCLKEHDSVDEIPNGGVLVDNPVTISSGDVTENVISMICSDIDQLSDGSKADMSDRENVSLTDPLENLVTTNANSLPDASSEVHAGCFANLSKVDGPVPLREPVVANSGAEPETAPSEVLEGDSGQRENDGTSPNENAQQDGVLCTMSRESALREPSSDLVTANANSLPDASSEVHAGCFANLSKVDGPVPLREHVVANSGAEPETAPSEVLEGGSGQRENDGTSPNENDQQDGVLCTMSRESALRKSSSDLVTATANSLPDASSECFANSSQADGPVPLREPVVANSGEEPETAPSEVLNGGSGQRENDGTSPNETDQQDSVLCTMSRESTLREPSSDLVTTNVNSLPYASSEVNAGCFANNEMQNASQAAETSPINGAIDVTCNVSFSDVTVVEFTQQMQQLRSFQLPSVSAVEHQSNSEGQTAIQSSQVPRQPVANHIELSNQDVLQPLDSPIDGVIDGLVSQASETRTSPVAFVSNDLPLWTAPAVTSRTPMISPDDPLQNEMKRIMKEKEQTTKIHEDTKLQLKLECDKEIEKVVAQIRRRYDVKIKEKEVEFFLHKEELDVNHSKVLLNKNLAEAFRSICMDNRASGSAGAHQEANSSFLQQRFQLSSQQMVQQPSAASGFPSTGSVSRMQTVSPAVVNAQTMGSPLQVVNPSALFSGTPTRPPRISTISSSTVNPQIGTEIRAPAPHMQPFRPSSSISPSSLPLHSGGMSSQQSQHNHPAASLSLCLSYVNSLGHRQASTTGQSGRNQHEIAGGFTAPPNSRSPSLNVLTGVIGQSGASANPPAFLLPDCSSRLATRFHQESHVPSSRSYSSQPSGGATDIVCLSDDD